MATIRSADQISIVDITDAYSVILTNDSHTFAGTTTTAKAGTATTTVMAMRGASVVPASVTVANITKPNGVSITSDGDSVSPTLTIAVTTEVTTGGVVKIPVNVDDITINKEFTFNIAFTGATGAKGDTGATGNGVKSTEISYQASSSGTSIPTDTWGSTIPTVSAGQYLWTRTVITYTDNSTSTSYSVGMMGATGSTGATGKGVSSTEITYQASSSGTTAPTGTWSTTIPSVSASQYLWTRTVITYTDNSTSTSYSVGMMGAPGPKGDTGATGPAGSDAISIAITSSNGTIFKNSAISTILTAHVYKAGSEVTGSDLTSLGTIKWYKDGGTTAVATGANLTISAGDVSNKATYIAQLEA